MSPTPGSAASGSWRPAQPGRRAGTRRAAARRSHRGQGCGGPGKPDSFSAISTPGGATRRCHALPHITPTLAAWRKLGGKMRRYICSAVVGWSQAPQLSVHRSWRSPPWFPVELQAVLVGIWRCPAGPSGRFAHQVGGGVGGRLVTGRPQQLAKPGAGPPASQPAVTHHAWCFSAGQSSAAGQRYHVSHTTPIIRAAFDTAPATANSAHFGAQRRTALYAGGDGGPAAPEFVRPSNCGAFRLAGCRAIQREAGQ